MRRHFEAATVVAAVGVLLLSGLPSEAQETSSVGQAPELKVLERFVGTWEWKITLRPAEWAPNGKTITFDTKTEWILEARMIQFQWAWSPGDETIHCTMLMGYDAEKKHYTDWYFDSTGVVPEGESVAGVYDMDEVIKSVRQDCTTRGPTQTGS